MIFKQQKESERIHMKKLTAMLALVCLMVSLFSIPALAEDPLLTGTITKLEFEGATITQTLWERWANGPYIAAMQEAMDEAAEDIKVTFPDVQMNGQIGAATVGALNTAAETDPKIGLPANYFKATDTWGYAVIQMTLQAMATGLGYSYMTDYPAEIKLLNTVEKFAAFLLAVTACYDKGEDLLDFDYEFGQNITAVVNTVLLPLTNGTPGGGFATAFTSSSYQSNPWSGAPYYVDMTNKASADLTVKSFDVFFNQPAPPEPQFEQKLNIYVSYASEMMPDDPSDFPNDMTNDWKKEGAEAGTKIPLEPGYNYIFLKAAGDGIDPGYWFVVYASISNEKEITSFKVGDKAATIDQNAKTIKLVLPYGTDLKKLKPDVLFSEFATLAPVSGAQIDFTNTVDYVVTAEDGSKATYKVTITTAPYNPLTGAEVPVTALAVLFSALALVALTGRQKRKA